MAMEAKSITFNSSEISAEATEEILHCPSCNMKLKTNEVASHCEVEIESLRQTQDAAAKKSAMAEAAIERRKPYSIFQRVQRNRQTRLKQRTRRRATPPLPAETTCPICNKNFPPSEIQRHAEKCLRRSNGLSNGANGHSSNEEDDTDEGCGEEYEEYEWAGQKRIRASSLLGEGGYARIGIGQSVSNRNGDDDDDEDLNVDEDDTHLYGPSQYDEADVIPTRISENTDSANSATQEEDVTSYMRSLITGGTKSTIQALQANETRSDEAARNTLNQSSLNCQPSSSTSALAASSVTSNSSQQIIDSLKTKLRHYENHVPTKYKCLICLDDYKNPAISVACWHVHCEECWLRSLGSRKLCPQCNLITSPKDLRRIYL